MRMLEKRLRALEARFMPEPIVLFFEDGTTREIRASARFLLSIMADRSKGVELGPRQAETLELIRRSVAAEEPGEAHFTDLVRMYANAPDESCRREEMLEMNGPSELDGWRSGRRGS